MNNMQILAEQKNSETFAFKHAGLPVACAVFVGPVGKEIEGPAQGAVRQKPGKTQARRSASPTPANAFLVGKSRYQGLRGRSASRPGCVKPYVRVWDLIKNVHHVIWIHHQCSEKHSDWIR